MLLTEDRQPPSGGRSSVQICSTRFQIIAIIASVGQPAPAVSHSPKLRPTASGNSLTPIGTLLEPSRLTVVGPRKPRNLASWVNCSATKFQDFVSLQLDHSEESLGALSIRNRRRGQGHSA
jgi:hypothetical protein